MERVTRIELVTEAWEAFVIPFHHTRAGLSGVNALPHAVKRQSAWSPPSTPTCATAALVVVQLRNVDDAVEDRERFYGVGDV